MPGKAKQAPTIGSDLVQRLRAAAKDFAEARNKKFHPVAKLLDEAADRLMELSDDLEVERRDRCRDRFEQSKLIDVLTEEIKKSTAWPPRRNTK